MEEFQFHHNFFTLADVFILEFKSNLSIGTLSLR